MNHHLEPGDSLLSVCILAALLRTNHGLSCGRIDRTNSRFHFIDILTAFSAASEGIEYDQLGVKFFGFNCCTMALENFILGFRLGMRTAIDALDEDDAA